MKKSLSFAVILALFWTVQAFSQESEVVVSAVRGDVQIKRDDTVIPAKAGMSCQKNDVVVTGAQCQTDITLNKMAGCRLLKDTSCTVANPKIESMEITVNRGNILLNLRKLPKDSTFKVETPTAVATVRGTQFWGHVIQPVSRRKNLGPFPPNVTTFAVREGAVEVLSKFSGRKFNLNPGDAIDIPHEALPIVRKALPEEMKAMEQTDSIKTE